MSRGGHVLIYFDYVGLCIRAQVTALPLDCLVGNEESSSIGLNTSLELLLGCIKERSGGYRYLTFNRHRV
jgi:hypothetical protein